MSACRKRSAGLWEGEAQFEKEGDYEFNCARSTAPASSFVRWKSAAGPQRNRLGADRSQTHLSAGAHAIKLISAGKSDFMTIGYRHWPAADGLGRCRSKKSLPTLYLFSK